MYYIHDLFESSPFLPLSSVHGLRFPWITGWQGRPAALSQLPRVARRCGAACAVVEGMTQAEDPAKMEHEIR